MSLPALLRVAERRQDLDVVVWSGAPGYAREIAALLRPWPGAGALLSAPAPSGSRRSRSGDAAAVRPLRRRRLARLRCFGERVTGEHRPGRRGTDILVTRASASRALANEAAVAAMLAGRSFAVVDPGRHPVAEQIAMFRDARTVVGPHGAGLANLAWCSPGTSVVELLQPDRTLDCYGRLAHLAGLPYRALLTSAGGEVDLDSLARTLTT